MPIPISHLFKSEDDIHCYPDEEALKKMAKPWPLIPINVVEFSHVEPPEQGSTIHDKDLSAVKDRFTKPVYGKKILKVADDNPFSLFESFLSNNKLEIDHDKYEKLNDQLSSIVLSLKFKYNRPRPKKYMEISNDKFIHHKIEEMDTPSYPSGHASHAFFNATLLSDEFPKYRDSFNKIANMIGQTRIDLGKHYPTDCSFGKYVGIEAANACMAGKKNDHITIKEGRLNSSQRRESRKNLYNMQALHNKKNRGSTYVEELCEFIIQSNLIERYPVDITEALNAARSFMKGLPVEYCTDNKYIRSHLSGLETAACVGVIDTPLKLQQVHTSLGQDVMERGTAGEFRNFKHSALSTGYSYSDPENILSDLLSWCNKDYTDAFERHAAYECIHPFADGNGRSGRIILVSDLGFDLMAVNMLIGNDYIPRLVDFQTSVAI